MNTNAKLSNNQNEQDRTFDRIDTEVRRLRTLTATDGTQIPFTGNMKIVYAYLYTFYTNEKRLNYPDPIYPNLRLIAEECGISLPTTKKSIDDLAAAGVLEKHTITVRGSVKSNSYGVMLPADVVARNTTPARQPTHKKPDLKVVTNEEPKSENVPQQCSKSGEISPAVETVDQLHQAPDEAGSNIPDPANAERDLCVDNVSVLMDEPEIAPIWQLEQYIKPNSLETADRADEYVLQWLPEKSSRHEKQVFLYQQLTEQRRREKEERDLIPF